MASKMVTDRQKNAAGLLAVLDAHAEEANDTFATLVKGHLQEGEEAPSLVFLQELLRRNLAHLDRELVQADERNLKEKREDRKQRRLRDTAVAQLSNLLSRLRQALDAACGSETCANVLGIEGSTPRDPVVLHRFASRVLQQLQDGGADTLEPTLPGFRWDSTEWISALEAPIQALGDSLAHLTLERRDSVSSHIHKRQVMDAYDVAYLSLARVMENLFRHTGLKELAERVRPSSRSPAGTVEIPDEDTPEAPVDLQEPSPPDSPSPFVGFSPVMVPESLS